MLETVILFFICADSLVHYLRSHDASDEISDDASVEIPPPERSILQLTPFENPADTSLSQDSRFRGKSVEGLLDASVRVE